MNTPKSPLVLFATVAVPGALVTSALMFFDPRTLVNEPLWLKPTKFFVSAAIYALSLAWALGELQKAAPEQAKKGRLPLERIALLSTLALSIEMVAVIGQAARGVRSHFNFSSPINLAIFNMMGLIILGLWFLALATYRRMRRAPFRDKALGLALSWGMLIFLFGSIVGNLMSIPNASQRAVYATGQRPSETGAHTVGAADGSTPTYSATGWSRTAGDLRIPHFVGMHGLQVIPFCLLLIRWGRQKLGLRDARNEIRFVQLISAGYLLVFLGSLTQAYQALPLHSPQGPSLMFYALGLGLFAIGGLGVTTANGVTTAPDRRSRA